MNTLAGRESDNAIDSGHALAAGIALTVISMAAFLVLPLFVGAAATDLGFNQQQIGFLSAAVAGGSALSSVIMMLRVRSVNWRRAARFTLALLLVSTIISLWINDKYWFLVLQAIAALGSGSTYSLALTALSDRRHPDRAFGLSVAAQVAFQVVGMLILPGLVGVAGIDGVLGLLISLQVTGLLLLRWLPEGGRATVDLHTSALVAPVTLLSLGGCFFFFFNVGAVWTYIERMAVLADISAMQIGTSLAAGVSLGIPGALLASWCGDRFGRIGPLALGTLGTLVALVILAGDFGLVEYVLAIAVYNFVWNFSLPFQYAAVNAVDDGGRGVAAAPAFHGAGVAAGPAIAAFYVTESSLDAVSVVAGLGVVASFLLFALALARSGRRSRGSGEE